MDILIKNMKMPSCCDKCFFVKKCSAHAVQLKKMAESEHEQIFDVFGEMRLSDCPLVELPSHGDLIDRSALLKQFEHDTSRPTGYEVVSKIFDAEVVLERTT